MKKIIFIYTIIFIIILSLIGWKDIINYLGVRKANSEFSNYNYSGALEKYKKIKEKGLSISNKDILNFNKGINYLREGQKNANSKNVDGAIENYKKSEKYLGEVKSKETDLEFYKNIILGENNYLSGSGYLLQNQENETVKSREKSITNYQNAINIDTKIDKTNTIKNYEFVKKELEKLKKKIKEKEEQKQLENNNSSSGGQSNGNKSTGSGGQSNNEKEKPGEISGKNWTNEGQFNGVGNNQNEENKKTSQEELNELKNYSDSLKQFQKNNLQYLQRGNPETNKDAFDRMMNQFSQDPFFNDVLPNNEGKKDW